MKLRVLLRSPSLLVGGAALGRPTPLSFFGVSPSIAWCCFLPLLLLCGVVLASSFGVVLPPPSPLCVVLSCSSSLGGAAVHLFLFDEHRLKNVTK